MSDITVRKVGFEFPDDLGDVFPGEDIVSECYLAAFSLTMPVLEPYLIRSFRSMVDTIADPVLAADVRQFILQEAQHHKNHAKVNRIIHAQLGPAVAAELSALEDRLDRDYHRYNETKSAKFNAVYAEGFEAMTCAMVMSTFERTAQQEGGPGRFGPWQQLYAWHGAEEIEHRTVAFGVYDTLFGGYLYRVYGSLRAQIHFGLYVARLQRVLLVAHGQPRKLHMPSWWKTARSHYLRTFRRGYDPADLQPDPLVQLVLSMYTPADPA